MTPKLSGLIGDRPFSPLIIGVNGRNFTNVPADGHGGHGVMIALLMILNFPPIHQNLQSFPGGETIFSDLTVAMNLKGCSQLSFGLC